MSDIRFNSWYHQSGTGGVYQDGSGNIGIGISTPSDAANPSNNTIVNVGIVTANYFYGDGSNLSGVAGELQVTSKTSAYTLTSNDANTLITITTGGVTVPASVFATGQSVLVYNDSASSQTITQGTSVTLRLAGTSDTGNRTLEQRGLSTILCVASNEFVVTGSGIL